MKTKDGRYECDNCFVDISSEHIEYRHSEKNKHLGWLPEEDTIVPEKLRKKTGFEHLCKVCFDALRVEMMQKEMNPPLILHEVPVDME